MESIWMEDTKIRKREPLPGDMEVQAVVIGAGLADIFSPQRHFTAQAAKELAVHGVYTVKGLAKHLLPSGSEKVIPNCPHMGCRLEWNPDGESYDCPCHGSRFDGEGHLLDGPAQTDCKRRDK